MTDPRPQLLAARCSSCVFHPGNRMWLEPGRLAELVAQNRAAGAVLICHDTLSYGAHPEVGEAMCRGYWDAYATEANVVRVMERLAGPNWYREIPPPDAVPVVDRDDTPPPPPPAS